MASTFSPNLRLELIGTGEQQGTWGITTNTNLGTLIEQAVCGYASVTVDDAGNTILTVSNGEPDESRNMVIELVGVITADRTVICPAIEKIYVVKNSTSGGHDITFKVTGQTGVVVPNGETVFVYVDGTDANNITGSIATQYADDVSITGGVIDGVDILNGTMDNTSIANVSIEDSTITNGNVTGSNASNLYITTSIIEDTSITNGTISGTSISNASINVSSITDGTMDGTSLTDVSISNGTMTGTTVSNASISNPSITNGTMNGTSITNVSISNSTITNVSVSNLTNVSNISITSGTIDNVTISTSVFNGGTINSASITSATITSGSLANASASNISVNNSSVIGGTMNGTSISNVSLSSSNVTITGGTITGISNLASNNVSITGGNITGISNLASSNVSITGGTITGVTNVESTNFNVGNATDTTITRAAAGVIAVEGNQVPSPGSVAQGDVLYYNGTVWARLGAGTSGQYLFTSGTGANPSWQYLKPIVSSAVTTTSPWAWNSTGYDEFAFTALSNNLTISADSGSPYDGQKVIFRIKASSNANPTLSWATGTAKSFRAIGAILPTSLTATKTTYVGCIYNSNDTRWDVVAVTTEL